MKMINEIIGNVFLYSNCITLIPVNCIGIMGAGLALEFKNKYYNEFLIYKNYCDKKIL
jgi:hypothetical protein